MSQKLRILLVDDDELQREIVSRRLVKLGFGVVEAGDGAAGLLEWLNGYFDLVISDCHMPTMDGFQLAEKIRSHEAERGDGKRVRFVAITADTTEVAQKRAEEAGMDCIFLKPLTKEKIDMLLAQRH